jgi:hypothetical protein
MGRKKKEKILGDRITKMKRNKKQQRKKERKRKTVCFDRTFSFFFFKKNLKQHSSSSSSFSFFLLHSNCHQVDDPQKFLVQYTSTLILGITTSRHMGYAPD